eukprot:c27402_g1_i1 orf=302-874(+)
MASFPALGLMNALRSCPELPACATALRGDAASFQRTIRQLRYLAKITHCPLRWRHGGLDIKCKQHGTSVSVPSGTEWVQRTIKLPAFRRGCHIITQEIYKSVPEINQFEVGIANLFVMHTSASLTVNENTSPDVPLDMEDALNRIVPQGNQYRHLDEGFDDMPAHVKVSLMGCSLAIPIKAGRLNLGIWQ